MRMSEQHGTLHGIAAAIVGAIMLSSPLYAQEAEQTDPVLVFNKSCYSQVPVIENIRDIASRMAWQPIGGEDLKQFTPLENPKVLEGWDARILKRLYRLGVVRSDLSESAKAQFPDFSNGVSTSCSLILDGADDSAVILERMNKLVGKAPLSENVPEAEVFTTTWAGGNENFKVFVFMKANDKSSVNLLNVTIFSKE